jgi:hypothetical protein
MKHTSPMLPGKLHDLLVDRALEGLSDQEYRELDQLLDAHPNIDSSMYDMTVAELDVTLASHQPQPMPADLLASLHEQGRVWCHATQKYAAQPSRVESSFSAIRSPLVWTGWLAAAACLMLVIWQWGQQPAVPQQTPEAMRTAMLRSPGDAFTISWSPQDDPAVGASFNGDIIWSNERQEGYLRLRGLASNTPSSYQYQLWIVDAGRPDGPPIDGGVFDIADDHRDIVIPINAKLPVFKPELFAITVEPPGGVVVSKQDRLALVASVEDCD